MDEICSCEQCELKELFFQNVSTKEMQSLCNNREEKQYDKGDYIIEQGKNTEEFIYLKSGLVKLFVTNPDEKEQILSFAKPFDFVSLLSVFSQSTHSYSVKAIEESTTCNISIAEVKRLVLENGNFAMSVLEKMSQVSDRVIGESLEIRRHNLRGRVAYVLLHFSNNIYKNTYFELPVSRKEIAEYIGMTTENVIRALTEFRKDGIIKIFGKVIEIIDLNKLKQICDHG
jgi:CRP/FNR family transcriptional regulator